jgi:phage tail sheath protein FI
MAAYTYPGVYIEEISSGQHNITGVATSIGAFIGWSNQGPAGEAVLVESWAQYETLFGGMIPGVYLGYAVYQFFLNGGSQAYIVRLKWTDVLTASNSVAGLTLYANNPGAWGNDLFVLITQPASFPSTSFNLQVLQASGGRLQTLESYTNLSTVAGNSNYAVTVIDAESNYISFLAPGATTFSGSISLGTLATASTVAGSVTSGTFVPYELLKQTTSGATAYLIGSVSASGPLTIAQIVGSPGGSGETWVGHTSGAVFNPSAGPASSSTPAPISLNGGTVPLPQTATSTGNDGTQLIPGAASGDFEMALNGNGSTIPAAYPVLGNVPIFNLLCVPGENNAAIVGALQEFCAQYRAFLIVDSAQTATVTGLSNGPVDGESTPATLVTQYASNSAFYFPWVTAPDPMSGYLPAQFPPCGFVAGIYASTDATRGVWKAPAGIEASLTGAIGLQYILNDQQNGQLNPQGVNCLRQFPNFGNVVWGARTIAGNNALGSQWMYVPIRRLALFLESSLYSGTQWAVFEPNAEPLWGQVRLSIGTFLQGLFLQGAFAGTTPTQAYFVKCDADNNTPATTALGILNVTVGFAPLYPAEFVVIQIQQMMNQS